MILSGALGISSDWTLYIVLQSRGTTGLSNTCIDHRRMVYYVADRCRPAVAGVLDLDMDCIPRLQDQQFLCSMRLYSVNI